MTDIFIKVIEMSATASIVIGVVMLLRLALKKAPKIFSYALWAAALFRLLCPISFELPSAPIPNVEIPYSAAVDERNAEGLFITHTDTEIAPAPEYSAPQTEMTEQTAAVSVKEPAPVMETPAKRQINFIALASYIWALAVAAMALRGGVSWIKLSHSLSSAQKMGDKVYVSAAISDPFIMGIIRPRIYLPTGLSCIESDLIIRHEKAHMHRGDHIAKLIMYAALCISVYPQGYCAVYDRLKDMSGVNMIADIGNGTMNIMKVIDHKVITDSCRTEKLGVEKCVIEIRNALMNKFHEDIDESIIKKFLMKTEQELPQDYENVMRYCTEEYCKSILNALYKYDYNSRLMKLYVVGGGAVVMNNHNVNPPGATFITDICANAKGYECQAKRKLRKGANDKDNKSQA